MIGYYLILYISAFITAISLFGLFYYKNEKGKISTQLNDSLKELMKMNNKVTELTSNIALMTKKQSEYKQSIISDKRLGKIRWGGWHQEGTPNVTWYINMEVREIALSTDEKQSKFEVLSLISERPDSENWGLKEYSDYFYKKTGGGWMETDKLPFQKMSFNWITTVSKSEARQRKLEEILKEDKEEEI